MGRISVQRHRHLLGAFGFVVVAEQVRNEGSTALVDDNGTGGSSVGEIEIVLINPLSTDLEVENIAHFAVGIDPGACGLIFLDFGAAGCNGEPGPFRGCAAPDRLGLRWDGRQGGPLFGCLDGFVEDVEAEGPVGLG